MNVATYEALDAEGRPYRRPARRVGELPHELRRVALALATAELSTRLHLEATRRIPFGAPAFHAFGLDRHQAQAHEAAALLLSNGEELPLELCDGLFDEASDNKSCESVK